jgi:hypothetical protein
MSSCKKIQRIPCPAYNPDLTPSGLFLFSYIKRKLTEYDIPDGYSLKSAITHIFDETEQEALITVFETWINRFEWVREHERDYFCE